MLILSITDYMIKSTKKILIDKFDIKKFRCCKCHTKNKNYRGIYWICIISISLCEENSK